MARSPLFLLFLLSGFSGLVFEVLWVRSAALALGVTVYAVSTVVSTFMGGLALGGWLASVHADRRQLGVRAYALLELGIAASALAATWLLRALPHWAGSSWLLVALTSLAMLLPCTLMGATIPILSRAVFDPAQPSKVVGWLYATNTLGAMVGAFCTDMLLVPQLGVWNSAVLAACLNLTAGLVSLTLSSRALPGRQVSKPASASPAGGLTRLYWAYALSGATALAFQGVWVRLLGVAIDAKIWVFSMILTTFLGCLASGSWVGSSLLGRVRQPRRLLGLIFILIGLSSLAGAMAVAALETHLWRPPLSQWLWVLVRPLGPELGWGIVLCLVRSLVLFALPTFLMGLAFPFTCAAALEESQGIGEPIGRLYTVNTLGAIVGSLAAGFLLLPTLGVQRSLGLLAFSSLLSAALIWPRGRVALALGLAVCALYAALPGDWLVRGYHYPVYTRAYGVRPEEIVEFREDLYGTVAVAKGTDVGDVLLINGTMMMGSGMGGRRYSRMMAHLPLTLHPQPKKMLVICFGLGMTFGAASLHDELDSLRCVELSPTVLKVAHYFEEYNENVAGRLNSKIQVTLADGRNFQLRSKERYDVITFEPPPPNNPGVVNLYSKDYYELCRDHLTDNGVLCQWMPLKQFSDPTARMVTKTFVEVFPQATLWEGSIDDYLIIGSPQPIHLDKARLEQFARRFQQPLSEIGYRDFYDILASFKQGPLGLQRYAASGLTVSDNHPYLEYASSLYPVVEELRQSDLSALPGVVAGLDEHDLEVVAERTAALQSLQNYTNRSSSLGDTYSPYLLQFQWARHSQQVYPHNAYVEDVLGCSPARLAAQSRKLNGQPVPLEDLAFFQLLANDAVAFEKSLAQLKQQFPQRPLAYFLEGLSAREKGQQKAAQSAFAAGLERIADPKLRQALKDGL